MRKIFVIARREYNASVKSKAFLISLITMPVLMGGSIFVQSLVKNVGDTTEKRFAIIDLTPGEKLVTYLQQAAKGPKPPDAAVVVDRPEGDRDFTPDANSGAKGPMIILREKPPTDPDKLLEKRFELSEKVRNKELFGFVEIGPDVLTVTKPGPGAEIRYQTNSPTYMVFPMWLDNALNSQIQKLRSEKKHVAQDVLRFVTLKIPVETKELSTKDAAGKIAEARDQNRIVNFMVPFGLMMLMFMVIMIGATPLMQGILEEKMQRIAEVLLGSVRPFELMLGKLIGMVGVAMTLVAVYLGGGYWAASHFGFAEHLPVDLLIWFLLYQTLAVLMFGSLFIAVGAACTDNKQAQTLLFPVMMLAMLPMLVWMPVLQDPNSSFSTAISFFPFATPLLMIVRMAVPPGIPPWQPVVGVLGVLATTILCVYVGGRIFRVGILMQGKGAKFSDLFKWVFRG